MARLLHNPEDGSTISNVIVRGVSYFAKKDSLEFRPGEVVKVEDDGAADVILDTFGFLQEVTINEAKAIAEAKRNNKFKCDRCDYSADSEKKLHGHSLHHAREEKIDKELGIRVVTGNKPDELKEEKEASLQDVIDAEAAREGLVGDGLTIE